MNSSKSTRDSLFGGKLTILQPRKGYRFALDAVILAGLCVPRKSDTIVDLGTGCGVVPLILSYRKEGKFIYGVEIQESLAEFATRNVAINGMEDHVKIIAGDMRKVSEYFSHGSIDMVVSNPPYRKIKTGRINPDVEKAQARHEVLGSLLDVFKAAGYLLKPLGRLVVIYPAFRLAHLCVQAIFHNFAPKRLTPIFSSPGEEAQLVVLECRKGGGEELKIAPPFYIYDKSGEYSPEMTKLYKKEKQ